ncbi:hypothetical protein [Oceanobacter mangrovi]|uniref:hypothetical protein n=1 Tax=Oceanobacter mangrovi TaxID=2862510 RepID=UPI001C8D0AD0|nr:hypothetical protein [Oceanobacter mangrovi]
MSDVHSQQSEQPKEDNAKWIGVGFIIGIIVAVVAMEYYGYIKHPSKADEAVIDEFRLLSVAPEAEVRVSPKPSGKEAFCVDGYLLLRPTNGKAVAGILVDGKQRPVACDVGRMLSQPEKTDE